MSEHVMSDSLDEIVGTEIWLDYFDQNVVFEEAFIPQTCRIIRRFTDEFGHADWYLVKLSTLLDYQGKQYSHLMIRSRWVGHKIGDPEPTAVFIVLSPEPDRLTEPFRMERSLYIAWGMAYRDTKTSRDATERRENARKVMGEIGTILFEDWDPIGVKDYAPRDEYDAYVGVLYRSLASGASAAEVAEVLRQLEHTQMQVATSPARRLEVAEKLTKLDVSIGN